MWRKTGLNLPIIWRCLSLKKELHEVEGVIGGLVFECRYAKLPEGCGKTLHCDGCTIRNQVMDTAKTGRPYSGQPALLNPGFTKTEVEFKLKISTEKINDLVLLRIDEVSG